MATDETIQSALEQAAIDGVTSASVDGASVVSLPIGERILADQYVKSQSAKSRNHLGLVFRKMEPGGCG